MTRESRYRVLFLLAGLGNIAVASSMMLGMDWGLRVLHNESITDPVALGYIYGFYAFIALFGIGFLIVALDLSRNRGIVALGLLGKLTALGIYSWMLASGLATSNILGAFVFDGVLIVLFTWFLLRVRTLDR